MPRKPSKRFQMELGGVDTRPRAAALVEHFADFGAMALGTGAGNGYVIVRCPKCLAPCVATQPSPLRWVFVHRARFVAGPRHTRMEPERACEAEAEVIERLQKAGAVSQGFASVADSTPAQATAIEAAIKARREELLGDRGHGG